MSECLLLKGRVKTMFAEKASTWVLGKNKALLWRWVVWGKAVLTPLLVPVTCNVTYNIYIVYDLTSRAVRWQNIGNRLKWPSLGRRHFQSKNSFVCRFKLNLQIDKSAMVQVMAWCNRHHYLNQWRPTHCVYAICAPPGLNVQPKSTGPYSIKPMRVTKLLQS